MSIKFAEKKLKHKNIIDLHYNGNTNLPTLAHTFRYRASYMSAHIILNLLNELEPFPSI